MKQIEVVAAIIHDDEGRIFATQRGYGEEALQREIWEELKTRIVVERLVKTVEWDYPKFHLTMHCFLCHIESGHPVLLEHESARWLKQGKLDDVNWLPADRIVVDELKVYDNIKNKEQ